MDTYPITEARNKLGALARQVSAEQKQVALTDRGQTMAVLISPAELEELEYHRVTAQYLARKERGEAGPGIPQDEARRRIFGDVA
ncbi:type II toxin-antitoxin system Phd/YefM family antitoxin [Kitasatospora sp. GP82]|uniref:type II toxin-antitoxin system Phd/YefM family antitoxin n=1 Tax=Kitasatospora sp. GP82 TaxID=3035089 RepID=UPI002473C6F8|nr:type II toxin-antitoxin system Phd/YefM family antitoxin [Kitasatospora sp. GP82]MDH6129940.1 prevent-host-death family protein [Kitasatospora sp. GP82]